MYKGESGERGGKVRVGRGGRGGIVPYLGVLYDLSAHLSKDSHVVWNAQIEVVGVL